MSRTGNFPPEPAGATTRHSPLLHPSAVDGRVTSALGHAAFILAAGPHSWVNYARIVRGQVIAVRSQDYVEAAHAIGVGTSRLLRRYVLPNTLSPIIVVASFSMAQAILTEAALTFLGVGVDPTVPSWGGMLNDGRDYLQSAWWIATLPGIAIALTVLGGNLLGDWLRDQLDPRLRR